METITNSVSQSESGCECKLCYVSMNNKHKVKCPSCNSILCMSCFEKFLIINCDDTPRCAICSVVLSIKFVYINTVQDFSRHTYAKHRTDVLISREKSLFPQTMGLVKQEIIKRNKKANKDSKTNRIKELKDKIKDIDKKIISNGGVFNAEYKKEKTKCMEEIRYLTKNSDVFVDFDVDISQFISSGFGSSKFITKCQNADCKGFVGEDELCLVCNTKTCIKCNNLKNPGHTCKQMDIDTLNIIKKETKKCPKCSVPIYRFTGCNHVKCTQCQTSFNYSTGYIYKNEDDNPYVVEWEDNTRTKRDEIILIDDEEEYTIQTIVSIMKTRGEVFENLSRAISMPLVINDTLKKYPYVKVDNDTFADLRVKFIINDITEDKYLTLLKQKYIKNDINKEIYSILDNCRLGLISIFKNYCIEYTSAQISIKEEKGEKSKKSLSEQCNDIRIYTNKSLNYISTIFGVSILNITDEWKLV